MRTDRKRITPTSSLLHIINPLRLYRGLFIAYFSLQKPLLFFFSLCFVWRGRQSGYAFVCEFCITDAWMIKHQCSDDKGRTQQKRGIFQDDVYSGNIPFIAASTFQKRRRGVLVWQLYIDLVTNMVCNIIKVLFDSGSYLFTCWLLMPF